MKIRNYILAAALFIFFNFTLKGQADFTTVTRLSFYSFEKQATILVHVPGSLKYSDVSIAISADESILCTWKGIPGKNILKFSFDITDTARQKTIKTEITAINGYRYISECLLTRLAHKPNEVKTDRLTGGLVVNGRPFFPFGFYCYSPVYPTLPEEEVVKGFNMISPYQRILPGNLDERRSYMDRCAALGMKVHYNLLSVSGGGGVGSKIDSLSPAQKKELLINEIKTFMDHPALLAWYIADEPTGNHVSPEFIEETYKLVRSIDPWHPVSVVFMAPFRSARDYARGTDIAMADPYPVPERPVSVVGDVTSLLSNEFEGEKPVWIVPQAFGGGELWEREPTSQELRSMTWQAIAKGARGIQFFIKSGLSSFPKSTTAWNECGRMAIEASVLTPWLLSDEETIQVRSGSKDIVVMSAVHDGQLVIIAVNRENRPEQVMLNAATGFTGRAAVMFENREVAVYNGSISDIIQPFGTLIYNIRLHKQEERVTEWKGNLIKDPGFESMTSPGIPTACYISSGGDRGATFFLDSREHAEGNYSLRLQTPSAGKSIAVKFFPVTVKTGHSYLVSLWAKTDPELRIKQDENDPHFAELRLGSFTKARFEPGSEWKQFIGIFKVPGDTIAQKKTNLVLTMPGQGTGWFDMIQMIEDPLIK
ncbi:MAG: hypothetical protein U0T33_01270 [Bacteroidales bacterium]